MSASQAPAFDAIALQLMARLDVYQAGVAAMLERWPDPEGYRKVSRHIDQIRLCSGALPDVRVQWVEVLLAHAELVHLLWRTQAANQTDARAQLPAARVRHADAVVALRNRCHRVIVLSGQRRRPAQDGS